MPPIPPYLVFFTIIFVVIPSITTIVYRLALYQHLVEIEEKIRRLINEKPSGEKPKIVKELERRFYQASNQLDQVNTVALIDQVYNREKVRGFTCEHIDYWCRILPNLLLAFGLLGTFFGITLNLSSLSQTITQIDASNVNTLVTELQKPLEGMSIAFITSFVGLLFSAALTVFNWVQNTSLAKYRLLSSLEDYLDNIYLPQVQGDTRLDKIVNKMVSQQDEFLTRFGSTVRDAVEQSLGVVAREISQGNREANELAKRVYEGFYQAAGTISTAANEFDQTITELNAKSHVFIQSAEIFSQSQFPQQLSTATANLTNTQTKFSQSAESLAATVESFATILQEVQICNQELIKLGTDIKNVSQTSLQVFDLHQSNQSYLGEIIPQLKQGASSFARAINKIDKLEKKMADKTDSLQEVEASLQQLLNSVNQYTEQANLSLVNVSSKIDTNSSSLQTVIKNIEGLTNQLSMKLETLIIEMQLIHKDNGNLVTAYQQVGDRLTQGINKITDLTTTNINSDHQISS